jgi:serpin B
MKRYTATIALSLALSLLPVFPSFPADEASPVFDKIAEGNNEFAIEMYRRLATPGKNLFISPLSIGTAFAMTDAGARGATREEIERVLRFKASGDELARSWSGLLADLNERAETGKFQWNAANRIWIEKKFPLGKDFVKTMKKSYDAAIKQVDFSGDPEGARGDINDWVAKQTMNKITGLVPGGAVTSATSLVLTNAVYFMGSWEHPFDEKSTVQAEFSITPLKKATVPMMKNSAPFRHAEYDDLSVISLPYKTEGKQDGSLSMVVLLPKKVTGLADIEKKMSAAVLSRWISGLTSHEVVVELPRFEVTSFTGLSEQLKAMGMKTAFSPGADFSGMAPNLFIGEAFHKAYVSVNEKGTEAAAATAILMVRANGGKKYSFRADHPFLFAIRDDRTGAVLFIGRVVDPLAK